MERLAGWVWDAGLDPFPEGFELLKAYVALFTGARQAELCQLCVNDIYREGESGIWVIDINEKDEKKLKTEHSRRKIPIHSQLIRLGFLDYVDSVRLDHPREGLFSRWESRNSLGEYSSFSKRFNRYKRKKGVAGASGAKKDFHSFPTQRVYIVDR